MATAQLERRSMAADELANKVNDGNANKVVASLCDDLDLLVDQFFTRIDRDVEQRFGMDSMLMPASTQGEIEASTKAHILINIYAAIVAADEAHKQRFVAADRDWITQWLLRVRVDQADDDLVQKRVRDWSAHSREDRRRQFVSALERRMPHATNAPLVLHRLFPLAVRVVTAVAFGDHFRAGQLRNRQISLLPVIADCHDCHGGLVDNGETCSTCGNPLWEYEWLCVAD